MTMGFEKNSNSNNDVSNNNNNNNDNNNNNNNNNRSNRMYIYLCTFCYFKQYFYYQSAPLISSVHHCSLHSLLFWLLEPQSFLKCYRLVEWVDEEWKSLFDSELSYPIPKCKASTKRGKRKKTQIIDSDEEEDVGAIPKRKVSTKRGKRKKTQVIDSDN